MRRGSSSLPGRSLISGKPLALMTRKGLASAMSFLASSTRPSRGEGVSFRRAGDLQARTAKCAWSSSIRHVSYYSVEAIRLSSFRRHARPPEPRLLEEKPGSETSRPTYPGLYLHIPFCSAICPYCDFAVLTGGPEQRQAVRRSSDLRDLPLGSGPLRRSSRSTRSTSAAAPPRRSRRRTSARILAAARENLSVQDGAWVFLRGQSRGRQSARASEPGGISASASSRSGSNRSTRTP